MTLDGKKPRSDIARAEAAIAALAAAYPEVTEDRPWGHRAFKVRKKAFLFLGTEATGLSLSVKLPESGVLALELPFTEPTHYGLGKSGWVSAKFGAGNDVPLSLVREWLTESYRAIAPKKLSTGLPSGAVSAEKPRAKRAAPKRRRVAVTPPRPTKPKKKRRARRA